MTGWQRSWIWLAVGWCCLVSAASGHAGDDPPQRKNKAQGEKWALLIGVDDYANAQDLEYCGADQRALREKLIQSGFAADNVYLLHDQAQDNKYRPSRGNIERQLDLVLKLAEKDDVLLLGFSGHGVHLDGKSYLCPSDAVLDDPESLVSMEKVYDRLKRCRAAFRVVLVDACRNDPRPGGTRSFKATEGSRQFAESLETRPPEGLLLFNSCAPGEISWEEKTFGHGVFMNFLLEGMGGSADADRDGFVSLNELRQYSATRTKNFVAKKFNDSQRPFLKGDSTSEALDFGLFKIGGAAGRPNPPLDTDKPGSEITNTIGMKLVRIPAGEFLMGSTAADVVGLVRDFSDFTKEFADDEQPQHRVKISKAFYLGKHEVTKGEFAKFVATESFQTEPERDGQGGWGYNVSKGTFEYRKPQYIWKHTGWSPYDDSHPVVNVTWNDAKAFCAWLSRKEEVKYRLPTEAEWEYACRAGTATRHPGGDDTASLARIANIADQSTKRIPGYPEGFPVASHDDGYKFTSPVGSFAANSFGLHDMIGNVWEWCDDVYDSKSYSKRSGLTTDPLVTSGSEYRVLRGGSWIDFPRDTRSALRDWDTLPASGTTALVFVWFVSELA